MEPQMNKNNVSYFAKRLPLFMLFFLSACSSIGEQVSDIVFIPHSRSAEVKGEKTELELFIGKIPEDEKATAFAGFAVGATAVLGAALDGVEKALEAESKRYLATYSSKKSAIIVPKESHLYGFRFTRFINVDESGNNGTVAMRYCAIVIDLGDRFFAIKTIGKSLYYSKAKVVAFDVLSPFGFDLLNPWELVTDWFGEGPKFIADDDIDMTINLAMTNIVFDTKKNAAVETEIGKREIKFEKLAMTETEQDDECTTDKFNKESVITKSIRDSKDLIKELKKNGANLDSLPIFLKPQPAIQNGNQIFLNVSVNVTEMDDFGTRVKELSEKFKSERPGIEGRLNGAFSAP